MRPALVLLEDRLGGFAYYFNHPVAEIKCLHGDDLPQALAQIDNASHLGYYAVGYVAYEAAYYIHPGLAKLAPDLGGQPLVHFYLFQSYEIWDQDQVEYWLQQQDLAANKRQPVVYHCQTRPERHSYNDSIAKIKQLLLDGQTYQVNFTGRYNFDYQGGPWALYASLRQKQKVAFSALFIADDYQVLSLSPELFFSKQGTQLTTKPMKGTVARGADSSTDQELIRWLQDDPKIRAENTIIVDLLRNDFSRVAKPATVEVKEMFTIENYQTVHQMVSTIQAEVDDSIAFSKLLYNLFPCGSVTGAPKVNTLKIIKELEQAPRGVYTGALGMISPNNDMCFNVAIRTIRLEQQQGQMGVGGGIVYASDSDAEFDEMHLKAKFLTQVNADFELVETCYYDDKSGVKRLAEHIARLTQSAHTFGFAFDQQRLHHKLTQVTGKLPPDQGYKIRIALQHSGAINVTCEVIEPLLLPVTVGVLTSVTGVYADDVTVYHKTTGLVRQRYQQLFAKFAKPQGYFDLIVVNQDGFIAEGTRTNVFIKKDGIIMTPARQTGLLPGIMRDQVISKHPVQEQFMTVEQLLTADEVWLTNSVRGVIPTQVVAV